MEDVTFGFVVSKTTFADVNKNDVLTYTAKLASGNNLPSWLSFDDTTVEFNGIPENSDVGELLIELTATDNYGESVSDIFTLEVVNINDAPELINEIADQEVDENSTYLYTIPAGMFKDIDLGDELTISATSTSGSLPDWLSFNAENGTLSGIAANPGYIDIVVTATDKAGASVSDEYRLSVKSGTTGLEQFESTGNVKVYPNPTRGLITIETEAFKVGTRFIIRDYHGKTVHEEQSSGKNTDIDLTKLSDGVYFIEMTDGNEVQRFKVILNK